MNKFLLIVLALLGIPFLTTVVGAVYFGWLGALAGLGLGFVLVKIIGKVARRKFSKALEDYATRMEAAAELMKEAVATIQSVEATDVAAYQEGDEDIKEFYPRNFYIHLELDPKHDEEWDIFGVHLNAKFDEDLLDDDQDPDALGYGLYFFGLQVERDGAFEVAEQTQVQGPQRLRLHCGVGSKINQVAINYHMNTLSECSL